MTFHYIVESRFPKGEWGTRQKLSRSEMLTRFESFTRRWGRYRLRGRGKDFGPWLTRPVARYRVRRRTARNDDDYRIFIQRRSDDKVLSIHKVETIPEVPDLGCHAEIEKAVASLRRAFGPGGVVNGGIFFCRYVDGTRIVSRHGYLGAGWKGAAADVFSDPDNMDALYDRARHLVGEVRQGRLKLDRIICGDDVWESYDGMAEPHYYRGVYHRHVHFEVHAGGACRP